MSQDTLKTEILSVLFEVAPELAEDDVTGTTDLRQDLDLDSMDFLNFVIGVHKKFGVEIPEEDYPSLSTLDGCAAYVEQKKAA